MNDHDQFLDDIAVYALGTLPRAEADAVRAHMRDCEICRDEYAALTQTATIMSASASTAPSDLVKRRIMREVRGERAVRSTPLWPAYLVAAASFVIAVISTASNLSLEGRTHLASSQVAQLEHTSASLRSELATQRRMLADVVGADARRYVAGRGEVITNANRVYLALNSLPPVGRGKTYQAWTQARGAKTMTPSVLFVPDKQGRAVVQLPTKDAENIVAVAVSVEPASGSKAPTTAPVFLVATE